MHGPAMRLPQHLSRKFVLGTASGLLLSSLVFLVLFMRMYRGELENERTDAAHQVNLLLQSSLENAMLKQDLDGLRTIVERLGTQAGITGVMITNPAGEIRFSSQPQRIGDVIPPNFDPSAGPTTRFISDDSQREVLRSINPVQNRFPCSKCHGPVNEHPVNGILYVDFDAAPLRQSARDTTLVLMSSGALIVLLNIGGGWWFINRHVLKPVDRLAAASRALSRGELDTRVGLQGSDELATLGTTFDHMAASLQSKLQELHEKERFLQALIDAIPDGVRIIDTDYRVRMANRAYREQIHAAQDRQDEEFCYQSHDRDTPCPPTLLTCPLREIQVTCKPLKVVHRHHRGDGAELDVEIFAAPMHIEEGGESRTMIVESVRDLAHEIRFSHEQKLSELGRLAAGVAHEIHNPLTSVRLALHTIMPGPGHTGIDVEDRNGDLELLDREIDKCIHVTERLLRLSMAPPSRPELVELDRAVTETLSLLRWEAEQAHIEITEDLEEGLRVMATDSELRMVTLNLAQNAFHAMPDGGRFRVGARRRDGFIEVDFRDSGIGIPPRNLKQIFEPFFSRRADGVEGTGLGLPISRTIIEGFGGTLQVQSRPGAGSCFTVTLPDADTMAEV